MPIDSIYDFTDKALVELKAWLQPWFQDRDTAAVAAPPSFAAAVADLAATRDLRGYWRLGEGSSPFADTSGQASPVPLAHANLAGVAMTDSIVGALPPADDDGAVQFNDFSNAEYLNAGAVSRFYFNSTDAAMSVAAWFNPTAGTTANPATIAGIWLNFLLGGSGNSGCGYRLGVNYSALTPFFERRSNIAGFPRSIITGAAMVASNWYFLVGTYDPTGGHSFYVNGGLVSNDPTTFNLSGTASSFAVGYGVNTGGGPVSPTGGVDEVSVWGWALTASEVATLYDAGVTVDPGVGTVWHHGSGVPGSTLGADGDYYLDVALGDVWFRASGTWAMIWDEP